MSKPSASIHIFKPGTQTAMSGESLRFSESDLAATAKAYDPARHEAPLVIGHPSHDAPAYGWVQALAFGEDGLTATPHQIDPAFAELHSAGRFKKVSASFYRPDSANNPVPGVYYLRHVGFLGAQPPAVKGLRPAEFADGDDCITVEFGESEPTGMPAPITPSDLSTTHEDTTVTPEEAARLKQENADLQAKLDAATAAQAKAAADAMNAANAAFAEGLAKEARIPADSVPLLTAALSFAQSPDAAGQSVQFGEGDTAKPMHQALREFLSALPQRVEFGEVATKDRVGVDVESVEYAEGSDPDRIEADKKIRAHMAKHNVDYTTAARAVMK